MCVKCTCAECCIAPVWQLPCLQTNRWSASNVWRTLLSLSDTRREKRETMIYIFTNTPVTLHLKKRKRLRSNSVIIYKKKTKNRYRYVLAVFLNFVQILVKTHTLFLIAPWLNSAKEMREQGGVPLSSSSLPPSPSSSLERQISVQFWNKD